MNNESKPYRIASIAYDPTNKEFPFYTLRIGMMARQGGLSFGEDNASFQTLSDACIYLEESLERDFDIIKEKINERENNATKDS